MCSTKFFAGGASRHTQDRLWYLPKTSGPNSTPKNKQPRTLVRGHSVNCRDWLKARRPCANSNSLGLKDSRLKPQPPHVCHYNQNFSFYRIALLSRVTAE